MSAASLLGLLYAAVFNGSFTALGMHYYPDAPYVFIIGLGAPVALVGLSLGVATGYLLAAGGRSG